MNAPKGLVDWRPDVALGTAAARGGLAATLGSWGRFVLQLGTVVIIARILGPEEYGFAIVVIALSAAAELLRGSGLAAAVIQRQDLTSSIASSLHYITMGLGASLALILAFSGQWLGMIFGDERAQGYAAVLSIVLVCAGISAIPAALLTRNLEFPRLATIEVSATIAGCSAGIVCAVLEMGATALVAQAVVFALCIAAGIVLASPWKPTRPASWAALGTYLRFGVNVSFVQLLGYATRNVDRVMIGFSFGPAAAGIYAQAMQLVTLPLEQISGPAQRLALPVLSELKSQQERFVRYYRALVSILSYVLWPAFTVTAIFAHDIVILLFGPEWIESARIFQILVVAGFAQSLGYLNVWVFIASGNVGRQSIWAIISRPLVMGSMLAGLPWGPAGVAAGFTLSSVAMILPGFLISRHGTILKIGDLLRPLKWPAVLTLAMGTSAAMIRAFAPGTGLVPLMLGLAAALAAALVCLVVFAPMRQELTPLLTKLRSS